MYFSILICKLQAITHKLSFMFGFHEKRKLKQILYSRLTVVLLAVVVIFLGAQVWDVFQKERSTAEKKEQQKRELSELEERERLLQEEIERLETRVGLESEIRGKFEVGREEEGLIVVVDPLEEEIVSNDFKRRSLWQRVLSWFTRD